MVFNADKNVPVRCFCLILVIGGIFLTACQAQETVLLTFNGTAGMTTPLFKVGDKWEIRWSSPRVINISVEAPDGSVVAGTSGMLRGSFYLPKGGDFHLQIELPSSTPQPPPASGIDNVISNGNSSTASTTSGQPWNIQIVEFGAEPAPNQGLVTNSNYVPPATLAAVTPAPASPSQSSVTPTPNPAPLANLTGDQARAVVLIRGDNAEGTGFLIKTADGPVVITNLHVISNNPNVRITTSTGLEVTPQGLKGAVDRDLAMIPIKDNGYNYLELATDISSTAQPGDAVITPGNSQGGGVMLNTPGKVLGIGPQRVEFDNPIYHGNSGGPVFHSKSNKVVAVVTEAMKVDVTNDLDKSSFQSRNSAISGSMRYFGLRLDTVPRWEDMDWKRFQNETIFLEQFHEESRCLDSFLNASDTPSNGSASSAEVAKLYLTNDKIRKACEHYADQVTSGADSSQRLDAIRQLFFEINSVADTNMTPAQDMSNFYSFDQQRAKDELGYRKALKTELNSIGDDVSRIGGLPRRNATN